MKQTKQDKKQKLYVVDNVTFCSEARDYPKDKSVELMTHHTPATGYVIVTKKDIGVRALIDTGSQSQLERWLRCGSADLDKGTMKSYTQIAILEMDLKKGEYSTCDHGDEQPERLTFVVKRPHPTTSHTCLYKIHTSKAK